LYDTGVGSNGVSLPDGTSPDPHYTIIAGVDGSVASTTTVDDASYWMAGSTTSAWIEPSAEYPSTYSMPIGWWDYQTSFTLPADVTSVSITMDIAVDDFVTGILLNGENVNAPTVRGFTDYTPVTFTSSAMTDGTNTLTFQVLNGVVSATGLRVDGITGTYTTVPEPSCLGLLGFALLLFRRRSRLGQS
jgi:hypothetical protein